MIGRQNAQETLFYSFNLDEHIPSDHLLRKIDWLLDFEELRPEFERLYSAIGRPSIDPELLIRMMLIGYLYGIRSERQLVQEVHLNLGYRWFCKLGLEDKVPDRSTFSKNRHGRFAQSDILRRVFEFVVDRCSMFGLVGGYAAAVDGSVVEANASRVNRDEPEQVYKEWRRQETISKPVQDYIDALDAALPSSKASPRTLSKPGPQSAWNIKEGPGRFAYETNYLIDTDHGIIMDVEATPARLSQEIIAARTMLERSKNRFDFEPDALAADKAYGTGNFLGWLVDRNIAPHIPVLDRQHQSTGKYEQAYFQYDAANDSFTCLEGHKLPFANLDQNLNVKRYRADHKNCGPCPIKKACTSGSSRVLTRHVREDAREKARQLVRSVAYDKHRRRRKKVEMLFAHLKSNLKIRRLKLRALEGANEEFIMAATAQNLKRLAKHIPAVAKGGRINRHQSQL